MLKKKHFCGINRYRVNKIAAYENNGLSGYVHGFSLEGRYLVNRFEIKKPQICDIRDI